MAVNSISSVNFCAANNVNTASSMLERPGKFAKPTTPTAAPEANEEKKSGVGKKVAGTIVGLAVVAAALVALPKVFPNAIKVLSKDELTNAKFMQKVGHYTAKVGEAIGKYTYEPIAKLFSKKGAEAATNATANAGKPAADAKIYA